MANVIVTVASVDAPLPDGVTAGKLRITLSTAAGSVYSVQEVDADTASFSDVVPGDYVAEAQALDSTGAVLGFAVNQPFNVPTPVVPTFKQPQTVVVALG